MVSMNARLERGDRARPRPCYAVDFAELPVGTRISSCALRPQRSADGGEHVVGQRVGGSPRLAPDFDERDPRLP